MGRAFVDAGRGDAVSWYNTVRFETKGGHIGGQNIPINAVHTINNINFLGLLTAINQHAQHRETIVTVHHGNPQGFAFPLVMGTRVYGTAQALTDLMSSTPSDQLQIPNVSSQQVDQLRAQMADVRAKHLAGVEIRACNMGNMQTLGVLQQFFRSQYVAAPIVIDFFRAIPGINQTPQAQLQTYATQPHYRCYTPPQSGVTPTGPDLCVQFQHVGGSSYSIGVYTVQGQGPRTRWMRANFATGNAFQPPQGWLTGGFVVHGVVLTGVLRLPAEPAYRNNIQVHSGSIF